MAESAESRTANRNRQKEGADAAVRPRSVARRFGETRALAGLDMTVRRGDVYGFLGRNGAGKTTAIRILAGLIRPDSGAAALLGQSVLSGGSAVRAKVGFLVETPAFFPHLNAIENLHCHALLAGGAERAHILECLDLFGLENVAGRRVGGYSLGMRQRLGLAQAFLGSPDVIILDEPGIGLDPEGVIIVREIIKRYAREKGTTFLISSHILGEMERLCTGVGIIEAGRMVAEGSLSELGARGRVSVKVSDADKGLALAGERFAGSAPHKKADGRILLAMGAENVPELVRILVNAGLDVFEVSSAPATLEELYLDLVGKGKFS